MSFVALLAVFQVLTGIMLIREIVIRRRQVKRDRRCIDLALELLLRRIRAIEGRRG